MAAFRLSKWYLDCVTEAGEVSIVYTGNAAWGPIRLHYSSLLASDGQRVTTETSLRRRAEPVVNGAAVHWNQSQWICEAPAISRTVFACNEGSIEWHCIAPRARVRDGFGYVEHLVMTVAPWHLPLRTLRWGRVVTDSESIVWTDWDGAALVYRNAEAVEAIRVEDHVLELADGTVLTMDRGHVLRDGLIGNTALSMIPGVRRTFPARLLQVKECKWRSRALLTRPGANPVEAWVIHERVDWPD